jgi:hypothetical protein
MPERPQPPKHLNGSKPFCRAQLAALPGTNNKLVTVDDYRRRAEMRSFAEMVDAASGEKLQELVPWLMELVETADKHVVRIVPKQEARPFFAWAEQEPAASVWCPRTDSEASHPLADALEDYAAAV